jgi:hypothetical protein
MKAFALLFISCLGVLLLMLTSHVGASSTYDYKYGNASLWHSEVTYCDPSAYLSRTFVGYTAGFVPTYLIEDVPSSTYGYVGYQPSLGAIFVTFRGSEGTHFGSELH